MCYCYIVMCVCYFDACGCGMLLGCGCGMFPVMCMQKGAKCYQNLHLNELFLYLFFFKFSVPVGYTQNRTETEFPEPEIGTDRFQFPVNRITRRTEYPNRSVSGTRMPRVTAHWNAETWQSGTQAETPTCARINNPKTVRFPNGPSPCLDGQIGASRITVPYCSNFIFIC
jgi:hypothetical protein